MPVLLLGLLKENLLIENVQATSEIETLLARALQEEVGNENDFERGKWIRCVNELIL